MMAGTVTLLFTDLVGSTELLGRLGEDGAAELRRRHFAALREAVAEAGGREVKSLGDGLMIAFDSAAAAVRSAQEMQRRAAAEEVGLRVGLHAGEPALEDGDYFGTPVVVARRLCDRASAGQILASDLVRGLVGSRAAGTFQALGPITLKGLPDPVTAWQVTWSDAGATASDPEVGAAALQAPLPSPLARAETPFVGRDPAVAQLHAGLAGAAERLRLAAVGGEPGIGKTRLAAEFARAAHAEGAVVLFGRCDEEALVPYQPFAEAVRTYLGAVPAAAPLAAGMERLTGEGRAEAAADPSLERLALFDAVGRFLAAVGRAGPVLLILDDLHWADAPTLALLRHLVRSTTGAPGLIVTTYRDSELSRTHPLASVLADLRRDRVVERVALGGLLEADVATLLERVGGHVPATGFVRALHEETEGNPFFIEEIVRHLIESGTIFQRDGRWTSEAPVEDMGIPEGVREAVGRRLARLSKAANQALAEASVIGRRFEFDVLAAMSGRAEDELLDALDEALSAQLVVEAAEDGRAAYAFRHALVRETLYEELSLPRRQRLHLRAADALEAVRQRGLEEHAAVLALHLRHAGAAADLQRAIDWTLRAAASNVEALAWEEAAGQLETALELMEDADAAPAARGRVLERLADLHYFAKLDVEAGVQGLEAALQSYREAGMDDRAGRIHSRLARDLATYWGPTQDIPRAAEHVASAKRLLDLTEPTGAVALLHVSAATVAMASFDGDAIRRESRRAIEVARAARHPMVALNAELLDAWGAVAQGELDALGRIDAVWEEADRHNQPWIAFLAAWARSPIDFWLLGAREHKRRLDQELSRPRAAASPGQRRLLSHLRAGGDTLSGRLDLAEAALADAPMPEMPVSELIQALYRHGPEAVLPYADWIEADADRRGNRWIRAFADIWRGHTAAGTEALRASCEWTLGAVAMFEEGAFPGFAACERAVLPLRLARAGDLDGAREHAAAARAVLPRGGSGLVFSRLLAGEAALQAAQGDLGSAEAGFAAAAEDADSQGNVYDAAEMRRAWGVLLNRVEPIEAALETYRSTGAAESWVSLALAEREQVATATGR